LQSINRIKYSLELAVAGGVPVLLAQEANLRIMLISGSPGPPAGSAVGIIPTVFMVAIRRSGWLDKASRVFGEQAAAGAGEPSQTEA
jgi:hypothetical protein